MQPDRGRRRAVRDLGGLKTFALDAATGRELWRFDPFAAGAESSPLGVNRGVVYWSDGSERRIFVSAGQQLFALDARSGRPAASFGKDGRIDLRDGLGRDPAGLFVLSTTPGAIYGDLLILGTRVGEGPGPSSPGHVRAYDVRSGEIRWTFRTIPEPGDYGYATWPVEAWKSVGGANSWSATSPSPTPEARPRAPGGPTTHLGYNRFARPPGLPRREAALANAQRSRHLDLGVRDPPVGSARRARRSSTARGIPPTGTENYGVPIVTAGGLVFIGASKDERFRAFDPRTRRVPWETTLPAGLRDASDVTRTTCRHVRGDRGGRRQAGHDQSARDAYVDVRAARLERRRSAAAYVPERELLTGQEPSNTTVSPRARDARRCDRRERRGAFDGGLVEADVRGLARRQREAVAPASRAASRGSAACPTSRRATG